MNYNELQVLLKSTIKVYVAKKRVISTDTTRLFGYNDNVPNDETELLLKIAIEGYIASNNGEFPPKNPYAITGLCAGEEDNNLKGAAWFFGYWERSYRRNGEEKCIFKNM